MTREIAVLLYFAAVVGLTAGWDAATVLFHGWSWTISAALYAAAGRWPGLPWLAAGVLFLLWWYCFYRCWPFGGD